MLGKGEEPELPGEEAGSLEIDLRSRREEVAARSDAIHELEAFQGA
jgi:hypothetical protein